MNENLELIFKEVKDRLKDQLLSIDQIATKFSILLGFNGVIVTLLTQNFLEDKGLSIFLIISFSIFGLSILLCLISLTIRKYRRDPNPRSLYEIYKSEELEETKDTLILNFIESFEENEKKLNNLIRMFKASLIATIIGIAVMIMNYFKEEVFSLWEKIITNLLG